MILYIHSDIDVDLALIIVDYHLRYIRTVTSVRLLEEIFTCSLFWQILISAHSFNKTLDDN